jgi:hypothetical protein
MNEQGKHQAEMESMLQRFSLTESSIGQRQRVLEAARSAWLDASNQHASSKFRFARALAACISVILAVDVCGRLALAPWRPHPAFHSSAQSDVVTEDFHTLVPSARLLSGIARDMSHAKKTGLRDYRDYLNRLLNESQTEQPKKQILPNRHQGQYFPARPLSWHS